MLFSTRIVALRRHAGHKILRKFCHESARKRLISSARSALPAPPDLSCFTKRYSDEPRLPRSLSASQLSIEASDQAIRWADKEIGLGNSPALTFRRRWSRE